MAKPQLCEPAQRSLLLVIGTLQAGGAERQITDMANFWAAKAWKVLLVTWSGPEVADFYPLDERVLRVKLATQTPSAFRKLMLGGNLHRIVRLRRLLTGVRPDVVLSFVTESNLLTILSAIGLGLHVTVSERVQPALHTTLPWTWRVLRRILYRLADVVVAQTEDAARWLNRNCRTQTTVIPNALRDLPAPKGARRPIVVAVGRLTHQKGFDILLRAFARIASDFPEWKVTIIGDGEERQNLEKLRGKLLLDDRVEFLGKISDVIAWMSDAGVIVQPSRFEGFPNVVLEGMALGAAVISADCASGPSDMIEDGINGRLVPVDEVGRLADVMAELISTPSERARLGRAAAGVRERYRQEVVMDQWEACLFPRFAKAGTPGACQVSETT